MLSGILMGLLPKILTEVVGLARDFQQGKITEAEFQEKTKQLVLSAFADVEKAWAEATAEMYSSLMQAAAKNQRIARAWSFVVYSQTAILLWHQVGVSAFVYLTGDRWPSSGATADWAYFLVAGALGGWALSAKGDVSALAGKVLGRR